jgi:hypothetical protein
MFLPSPQQPNSGPILSKVNPVCHIAPYFFNIYYNIIITAMPKLSKWSPLFVLVTILCPNKPPPPDYSLSQNKEYS